MKLKIDYTEAYNLPSVELTQLSHEIGLSDAIDLLPDFLVNLSSESLSSKLNGRYDPTDPTAGEDSMEPPYDTEDLSLSLNLAQSEIDPIAIEPRNEVCPVVGVDVSSIRIGETSEGMLCALRGAVVWRTPEGYVYSRCGPLIFHLTDRMIYSIFHRLKFPSKLAVSTLPLANRVLGRLRNALERWIQRSICQSFKNSLVLLDGSLTAGTPDNPTRPMEAILQTARRNRDTVLAISKSTKLRLMGNDITKLSEGITSACLIDIDALVRRRFPTYPVQLLGRIFVAKLSPKGFSFRLDIDSEVTRNEAIESVQKLIGSDIVSQGYPETLRLAHILSTFTANEVIGIQRFLCGRYGLRAEATFNLRRSLFGPYGSSWEAS